MQEKDILNQHSLQLKIYIKWYFLVFALNLVLLVFFSTISNFCYFMNMDLKIFQNVVDILNFKKLYVYYSINEVSIFVISIFCLISTFFVWFLFVLLFETRNNFVLHEMKLMGLSFLISIISFISFFMPFTEEYTFIQLSYKVDIRFNLFKIFLIVSGFFLFLAIFCSSFLKFVNQRLSNNKSL